MERYFKGFVIKNNGDIFKGYWKYDNLKEGKIKCQNGDIYNRELFDKNFGIMKYKNGGEYN